MDFENKIATLKEIIDDHTPVEDKIDKLQDFLSDVSIRSIPIEVLSKQIFDTALSYAQEKSFEAIKNIEKNFKNIEFEDNNNPCNILTKLLKCWDICLSHTSTLRPICITDLSNFPHSFFQVLIETLSFCKNWGKDHEDLSALFTSFLTSLFRQCINTLNSFYDLLDSEISLDTSNEKQMEILLKILDETGKLATLFTNTDFKTLMDTWKRFGKLSTKYCNELKSISSDTITYHFKGLANSIISTLLYVNKQSNSNDRPIFCCRVLVKILEKLCDDFCDCISNDVMNDIIIMITNLYMYTEDSLNIRGFKPEFIKFITSNFTFIIDPFINVIIKCDVFKTAFLNYGKNIEENAIGYHILLLAILNKISTFPYEKQREWCSEEQCIIDSCFKNIDKLTKDICLGKLKIKISQDITQELYTANIYEATLLSICALICQITNSDFSDLIKLLLKYLLNGDFFSSLLSSDVWCFIWRLGSSELCYSHFKHLMQIYEKVKERNNNFNVVMLHNLIGRQYKLLSSTDKSNYINNFVITSNPLDLTPIARCMDTQEKKTLQRKLNVFTLHERISADLKNLEQKPSLNNLHSLMKNLSIVETCDVPQDERLSGIFIKMLKKIVNILGDSEGNVSLLLEDLTKSLLRAVRPHPKQVQYTTEILESMSMMCPYASSGLRLEFCRSFARLTGSLGNSHKDLVNELLGRLLDDEDQSVHQQAFESFEQLTSHCQSVEVLRFVATSVKKSHAELSKALSDYIDGRIETEVDCEEFFEELAELAAARPKHVCEKISQRRYEKMPRLSEPEEAGPGLSDLVDRQADKVCADLELLLSRRDLLKKDTCDRLRQLCLNFLQQCSQ